MPKADFDATMQAKTGNLTNQTPVFGNLAVDEYLNLSEEEGD